MEICCCSLSLKALFRIELVKIESEEMMICDFGDEPVSNLLLSRTTLNLIRFDKNIMILFHFQQYQVFECLLN